MRSTVVLMAWSCLMSSPFSLGFAPFQSRKIGSSSTPSTASFTLSPRSSIPQARKTQLYLGVDDVGSLTDALQQLQSPSSGFFTLLGMLPGMDADRLAALAAAIDSLSPWNPELPLLSRMVLLAPMPLAFIGHMFSLSFPRQGYRDGLEPYPRGHYDPEKAKQFYAKHPKAVIQRFLEVTRLSNRYLGGLLVDKYIFRNEGKMRKQRAEELLDLITKLGPTAVKVGQALSVRSDLLPDEYIAALSTLQDRVPPFCNYEAKQVLTRELGFSKVMNLKGIATAEPIASASIGQVYKATVGETNKHVAVKVQRPNVLSDIALDLHLVRELAPYYQKFIARSETDIQSLVNEWGRGFIAELDYREEAKKTEQFNRAMKERDLNAVMAPVVLPEYSTERILVTEWVEGTRIDRCEDASDIPRLCSVALNAYLVMLLELKSLHCDPHPGNLLRTKDGRLCILDFGMTLDVDPNLQYSLLEYIAHCSSDNYDKLPEDLVNLGFLKEDQLEFAQRSGLLEPLVYVLREIGKGGGASGVRDRIVEDFRGRYPNMSDDEIREAARKEMEGAVMEMAEKESMATGITLEVEELQRKNEDAFRIPEWFVYTSRAFITLEGVSLQADPNYSLIQSCFPYIAKRLVRDDSPRAQQALRDMLYGGGDTVNLNRLGQLANGYSKYTAETKSTNVVDVQVISHKRSHERLVEAEAAIILAKDSADVLLDPAGNLVQNLLMEEGAQAASAQIKDEIKRLFVDAPQQFRDSLPLGLGVFLPKLPIEDSIQPLIKKTASEEKAFQLVKKLRVIIVERSKEFRSKNGFAGMSDMMEGMGHPSHRTVDFQHEAAAAAMDIPSSVNALVNDIEPEQAALIVKELRDNLPKYTYLLGLLGTKFVSMLLQKASDNIESSLFEIQQHRDPLLLAAAKGLSVASQTAARTLYQPSIPQEVQEQRVLDLLNRRQHNNYFMQNVDTRRSMKP